MNRDKAYIFQMNNTTVCITHALSPADHAASVCLAHPLWMYFVAFLVNFTHTVRMSVSHTWNLLFPSPPIHPWYSEHTVTWLEDESVCEEPIKSRIWTIKAVATRIRLCWGASSPLVLLDHFRPDFFFFFWYETRWLSWQRLCDQKNSKKIRKS